MQRLEGITAGARQIRESYGEHTPIIEPLSLDEAYLDVTENLQNIPLARAVALAIRAKIKEVTGLNASAGISYNKFLAKLASDHRKPNGQFVITPEMGSAFIEALPVGKFHGIGPATSARMNSLGPPHRPRHAQSDAGVHASQLRQGRRLLLLDIERGRRPRGPREPDPEVGRRREYVLERSNRIRRDDRRTAAVN